jgi:hypothetical protein
MDSLIAYLRKPAWARESEDRAAFNAKPKHLYDLQITHVAERSEAASDCLWHCR